MNSSAASCEWDVAVDADGVALVTLGRSRPVDFLDAAFTTGLGEAVERILADPSIRGAVIALGKPAPGAGAGPEALVGGRDRGMDALEACARLAAANRPMRRMETGGKPFAAAIHATAPGGEFALCLACHHRVLCDDPEVRVGLTELAVGLLPAGGGTQRLPRLIGIERALSLMLEGRQLDPAEAIRMQVVDRLAPAGEAILAAKRWVLANPGAAQPWDAKGYRIPGGAGALAPHAARTFWYGMAKIRKGTEGNYPAPIALLSAVYEGTQLPIDLALKIEAKYFAQLLAHPVSDNLMRAFLASSTCAAAPDGSAFADRVFSSYIDEGAAMLEEGIAPALIENAARLAGMAHGPLAAVDERLFAAKAPHAAASGMPVRAARMRKVVEALCGCGRFGSHGGGGFYAPSDAGARRLWPGLGALYPKRERQPDVEEIKRRLLYIQCLESAKCLEEGIVADPLAADAASISRLGFPAWSGGTLSLVDMVGVREFASRCRELASGGGHRFRPPPGLEERAKRQLAFHPGRKAAGS